MKFANPALLRVFSALAVVAMFTAGVHEMRKGGGAAADFAEHGGDDPDAGQRNGGKRTVAYGGELFIFSIRQRIS